MGFLLLCILYELYTGQITLQDIGNAFLGLIAIAILLDIFSKL